MEKRDPTDFLYGLEEIAKHLGISKRQAKHRVAEGQIPSFKMGRMVCGSKHAIDMALRTAAAAARGAPTGGQE